MGIDLHSDSNREKILNLVKKHFSLEKESMERFEEHLYDPFIDETYQKILGDNSLKAYFDIPEHLLAEIDQGWKDFKTLFVTFCDHYNVSYNDFRSNSIKVNKNLFKIEKAIMNYYLETPRMVKTLEYDLRIAPLSQNMFRFIEHKKYVPNEDYLPFYRDEVIDLSSYRREISTILKDIGAVSIPKKGDLKAVLSLDFTDFFLAATGENWSSCISLESSYNAALWSGLPGTIVDPNRSILYITDGKKKDYEGIVTDRMLSRAFCILDEENNINPLRYFPSRYISEEKLKKITGIPFSERGLFLSKHFFEPLFFKNQNSCFIFQDNSCFVKNSGENIVKIEGRGHGYYYFPKNGEIVREGNQIFNCDQGLSGLIMRNKEIEEFENSFEVCDICDIEIEHEDDIMEAPNGDSLCERCFMENFFVCVNCGQTHGNGEESEMNEICISCFDNHYDFCDDCNLPFEREVLVHVNDNNYNLLCPHCNEDYENNRVA